MHSLGARVIPVRVDSQGLVVEDLPDDARLIYVSPAHQFPLGMPMSLSRRIELLAWAGEHDAAIIEDDYDSEFRFGGRPVETLSALDTQGGSCTSARSPKPCCRRSGSVSSSHRSRSGEP
jgi:GntR family transcriptional regulator/MocR family aminotransferase